MSRQASLPKHPAHMCTKNRAIGEKMLRVQRSRNYWWKDAKSPAKQELFAYEVHVKLKEIPAQS